MGFVHDTYETEIYNLRQALNLIAQPADEQEIRRQGRALEWQAWMVQALIEYTHKGRGMPLHLFFSSLAIAELKRAQGGDI